MGKSNTVETVRLKRYPPPFEKEKLGPLKRVDTRRSTALYIVGHVRLPKKKPISER